MFVLWQVLLDVVLQ